MYLLGYDSGTSSIKATLLDGGTGLPVASTSWPQTEMPISSPQAGFAEQDPQLWWENLKIATGRLLKQTSVNPADIKAIGISYQMHGLVCIDRKLEVVRPAIIWCDSRAVGIGQKAFEQIGQDKCLKHLLNSPGNFTASKLNWVKENEPDNFKKIYKILLPGDWLAMKMTGLPATTASGLSEMILWDFLKAAVADFLLDYYSLSAELVAEQVPTFGFQGELTGQAAAELNLKAGTPVTYRAGDQPNNALSLNVLRPGQAATTAGTSGVIYGVSDKPTYDKLSRVNTFLHVNNTTEAPRNGILLCVNGTGRLNSWLKHNLAGGKDYPEMNALAGQAPAGADGLVILPYGNGAERTLNNKNIGASVHNLDLNIHTIAHILRAGQEGIVFALNYGLEIMQQMGLEVKTVRAGLGNMFLSDIFTSAFAGVTGAVVELFRTDGAEGAARGAGFGAGIYRSLDEAFADFRPEKTVEPDTKQLPLYQQAYQRWKSILSEAI